MKLKHFLLETLNILGQTITYFNGEFFYISGENSVSVKRAVNKQLATMQQYRYINQTKRKLNLFIQYVKDLRARGKSLQIPYAHVSKSARNFVKPVHNYFM